MTSFISIGSQEGTILPDGLRYSLSVLCALAVLQLFKLREKNEKSFYSAPPGPKRLPLVGNILDLSHENMWEKAREWGKKYGPLVYIENLGTPMLFLNSYDVIVDLFEKRGNIYSSRPENVMLNLGGWPDWLVSLFPYGEKLRKSRQLLHRHLQISAVPEYYQVQETTTHMLLEDLLSSPQNFREHIRNSAGRSILKITYGYDNKNDPYVANAEKGLSLVAEAEGFFLVNLLPWLQYLPSWLPGTHFLEIARAGREIGEEIRNKPYERAKREISEGIASTSMISKLLESCRDSDGNIIDEDVIKDVAAVSYAAGADSTVSVLITFILAMVLHPEVVKSGQEELDRVIGKNTLPTMADKPNLPYINAIQKECLRWQTVVPFAAAHSASEDDIYEGYFIPKGTMVFSNLWAASRDPNVYSDPDEFIPERWLTVPGEDPPLDLSNIGFGIGRRICSGRHLANNSVFIAIASILSTFDIEKAIADDGSPITPKADYIEHFIRHPKPFQCTIKPRSQEIASLIRQTVEAEK